jgi:hypothetical protein
MDNGVIYIIHRIGTPRLVALRSGGVAIAGEYWQDTRPNCGQWGDATTATRYPSTRAALPDGGEWVETMAGES